MAPRTLDALTDSVGEQAAEFHRHGFVCLRNALAPSVVAQLVVGVERSRRSRGEDWKLQGPGAPGWRPLGAKDGGSATPGDGLSGRELEIAVGEAGRHQSNSGTLLRHDTAFDAVVLCEPVVRLATDRRCSWRGS
jgi:hypothetical protein